MEKPHHKYSDKNFPFNERQWVPNFNMDNINNHPDYIRVMTYNILCDSLLSISTDIKESDIAQYPYLLWENRRKKILSELLELKADIICLQEFEKDIWLIEELSKSGYDCAFKPRTGSHSEGCAIFWKFKKFKVENIYCLEYNINNKNSQRESNVYDRDNICIFSVLQYTLNPQICFIVANSHILFNKNRGDVKLAQVYQAINSMNLLKTHYELKYNKVNVIFCADLNSIPNSAIYKMITKGQVNCSHMDRRKISGHSNGSLESIDPKKLKSIILSRVTSQYKENSFKRDDTSIYTNSTWFNEILSVESCLNTENHTISLKYKDNFKNANSSSTQNLYLEVPLKLTSAYSEMLAKILKFMKNSSLASDTTTDSQVIKISPFENVTDLSILDRISVYGINIGIQEISKTLDFVKGLTLEPPMSLYGKGFMGLCDYIFYSGTMTPVRTLNIPDINRIAFDIGYLPSEEFPSDHISMCADFKIC